MTRVEANFDGLVGPTHNYAGLSWGNVASASNARETANPREAALQGLEKAWTLKNLGMTQGILPPHERPHMPTLRKLGFTGTDEQIIERAWAAAPSYVLAAASASPMWTANAGTISSSAETADGRVHITPANLTAMPHRSIEHPVTERLLRSIFRDPQHFEVHPALPSAPAYGDEGAANHTRFEKAPDAPGVDFFVYGASAFSRTPYKPQKFPARQTLEASESIARIHGLSAGRTVYAQQNPDYIDAGVFHNDVIAVGHGEVLFAYEDAFVDQAKVIAEIDAKLGGVIPVIVPEDAVPIGDVIRSYLFNSQLIRIPGRAGYTLILPTEAEETASVKAYIDGMLATNGPIREALYFDLRQSMRNGGGPACLRLRVPLTAAERAAVNPGALLDERLYTALRTWVKTHYRDRLAPEDMRDPKLLSECRTALDELTRIMNLGSVYDFQREGA